MHHPMNNKNIFIDIDHMNFIHQPTTCCSYQRLTKKKGAENEETGVPGETPAEKPKKVEPKAATDKVQTRDLQ